MFRLTALARSLPLRTQGGGADSRRNLAGTKPGQKLRATRVMNLPCIRTLFRIPTAQENYGPFEINGDALDSLAQSTCAAALRGLQFGNHSCPHPDGRDFH